MFCIIIARFVIGTNLEFPAFVFVRRQCLFLRSISTHGSLKTKLMTDNMFRKSHIRIAEYSRRKRDALRTFCLLK